jgi:hypothetical protein
LRNTKESQGVCSVLQNGFSLWSASTLSQDVTLCKLREKILFRWAKDRADCYSIQDMHLAGTALQTDHAAAISDVSDRVLWQSTESLAKHGNTNFLRPSISNQLGNEQTELKVWVAFAH